MNSMDWWQSTGVEMARLDRPIVEIANAAFICGGEAEKQRMRELAADWRQYAGRIREPGKSMWHHAADALDAAVDGRPSV